MVKYELNEREKGFIFGIILNTKNDYLKKNKFQRIEIVSLDDLEIIDMDNQLETIVEKRVKKAEIKEVMKKALTKKQQSMLFSYYALNKKDKEIAKEIMIKEDTVRKRRNRAIEKLRKNIKGDD